MIKIWLVLLLFLIVPGAFALSANMKQSYQPGETMIVEISGAVLESIGSSQVEFRRGNVLVPFEYDIKKIGGKWYLWAIAQENRANYTLIVKDVATSVNGRTTIVNLEKEFSVGGELIDYNVKPGFVFTAGDFFIDAVLNEDFDRTININYLGSEERVLKPGNNRLFFSIKDIDGIQFLLIGVGRYNLPAYILGEPNVLEIEVCEERWSCGEFGACVNERQIRVCSDLNKCGSENLKPLESQICVECSSNANCAVGKVCDLTSNKCVGCIKNSDCKGGEFCNADKMCEEIPCVERWSCGEFGACVGGRQSRSCSDLNSCGTSVNKPVLSQSCSAGACSEKWECGNWGECLGGKQNRSCTDANGCGSSVNKPVLSQSCESVCSESWGCGNWSSCVNGNQTRVCSDLNSCGSFELKPLESQSCVECTSNNECGANEVCKLNVGSCVECLDISDCDEDEFCSINTNTCVKKTSGRNVSGEQESSKLESLELRPAKINSTILKNDFAVYPLYIVNKGNDKLDLEFEFNEKLFSLYPEFADGKVSVGAGNIGELYLTLKEQPKKGVSEKFIVRAGKDYIELPIEISFTENAGEVSTDYVEQSFVESKGYYCRELSGAQCAVGEVCSGREISSLDGNCCVGQCEVDKEGGLSWIGWGLLAVVAIVIIIVAGRYLKKR